MMDKCYTTMPDCFGDVMPNSFRDSSIKYYYEKYAEKVRYYEINDKSLLIKCTEKDNDFDIYFNSTLLGYTVEIYNYTDGPIVFKENEKAYIYMYDLLCDLVEYKAAKRYCIEEHEFDATTKISFNNHFNDINGNNRIEMQMSGENNITLEISSDSSNLNYIAAFDKLFNSIKGASMAISDCEETIETNEELLQTIDYVYNSYGDFEESKKGIEAITKKVLKIQ